MSDKEQEERPTLRDWFALQFVKRALNNDREGRVFDTTDDAYCWADAMMKSRTIEQWPARKTYQEGEWIDIGTDEDWP